MHKWLKHDHSTVILCLQCSQKEYKKLEIREGWKKKDANLEVTCERCGTKTLISLNNSD